MNQMKKLGLRILKVLPMILMVSMLSLPAVASEKKLTPPDLDDTFKKGFEYLKNSQNPDGSWSNSGFPAITGLVTYAFLTSPMYSNIKEKPAFIQKALDYIISNAHENGAIYKEGLPNYNTSICMMALLAANDPTYHPYILKARRYIATLQLDQGEKGKVDEKFDGGIGYGSKDHSICPIPILPLRP